MEIGSWRSTRWGGAVEREIQIYKTSKKTGKSRAREKACSVCVLGTGVAQERSLIRANVALTRCVRFSEAASSLLFLASLRSCLNVRHFIKCAN